MTKLDFSKPDQLQTRDGRQVRIYATDGGGTKPIHGAVFYGGEWKVRQWQEDGIHTGDGMYTCDTCDLVRKPARVTGWLNVYKNFVGGPYSSLVDAKHKCNPCCLGQVYIDAEVQE